MSIRPLSGELQDKAIKELKEVPNRLRDDLDHIREWIRQQPHLNARTDDQWLLAFLRACKFSLQATKEKLDLYYTLRTISTYYFENRNPFSQDIQGICSVIVALPEESNPLAPRRILIISRNGDPDQVPVKKYIKLILMLADLHINESDAFTINGQEAIFDVKDASPKYIGQWTPNMLKTISVLLQRAYPSRLKGIHFMNVPPLGHTIINTFKSLLSKKLRDRIHIYLENDFDSLFKAISRDVFPKEYGGNAGSLNELSEKTRQKLESYHKWFQEDAQYFSDESKRPGKPTIADEFFNVDGSFRKLEID